MDRVPIEILLDVADLLDFHDRLVFSSTCKRIRHSKISHFRPIRTLYIDLTRQHLVARRRAERCLGYEDLRFFYTLVVGQRYYGYPILKDLRNIMINTEHEVYGSLWGKPQVDPDHLTNKTSTGTLISHLFSNIMPKECTNLRFLGVNTDRTVVCPKVVRKLVEKLDRQQIYVQWCTRTDYLPMPTTKSIKVDEVSILSSRQTIVLPNFIEKGNVNVLTAEFGDATKTMLKILFNKFSTLKSVRIKASRLEVNVLDFIGDTVSSLSIDVEEMPRHCKDDERKLPSITCFKTHNIRPTPLTKFPNLHTCTFVCSHALPPSVVFDVTIPESVRELRVDMGRALPQMFEDYDQNRNIDMQPDNHARHTYVNAANNVTKVVLAAQMAQFVDIFGRILSKCPNIETAFCNLTDGEDESSERPSSSEMSKFVEWMNSLTSSIKVVYITCRSLEPRSIYLTGSKELHIASIYDFHYQLGVKEESEYMDVFRPIWQPRLL